MKSADAPRAYCLDTSSLVEAWSRSYRVASFPTFWKDLTALIAEGRCVICEEVGVEVENDSHGLDTWIKSQAKFVVPFDREQELLVKQIMRDYPKLVNLNKNKGWADAFVVALAESRALTVVTEEGPGADDGPKIPLVCDRRGVYSIKLIELIEKEKWTY